MERDLTVGSPFLVLLRFSLPVIGGNIFQLLYTMADTMIVGRTLGEDALAAVGATTIIVYFVLCFIQGFTGGFGICLAHPLAWAGSSAVLIPIYYKMLKKLDLEKASGA